MTTVEHQVLKVMHSLLKEAIQDNTDNVLRAAVISLSNGIRSCAAVKASKIPLLKVATARMTTNYAAGSRVEKDYKKAKDNAARLVGVVNFLLQVEDIHSVINTNIEMLTTTRQAYMDELKKQYPDRDPIEPTIEQFLQNQYRPFRLQFLNLLNKRSPLTKDPQTVTFHKNTQEFANPQYELISPQSYDTFCKQLLKLTMEQFVDLSQKIQAGLPRVAALKRVVGHSSKEELETNFFHMPPKEEPKEKEVPDQPTIHAKF